MVRTLIYVMLIYVPPTIIFFKRLARQLMAIRALWGALVISLDSHFTFLLTRKRREGEIERMRAGERERESLATFFVAFSIPARLVCHRLCGFYGSYVFLRKEDRFINAKELPSKRQLFSQSRQIMKDSIFHVPTRRLSLPIDFHPIDSAYNKCLLLPNF